jgi:3-hydroxyacyl-[acyl-carrier-protein] dehydratase
MPGSGRVVTIYSCPLRNETLVGGNNCVMIALDVNQVRELIPQRYPFMLIDRVVEIHPWEKLVAIKNITVNEPYFQGHFPAFPVMPGVLMLEAMAQATIVLYKYQNKVTKLERYEIVLGSVKGRFLRSAYPGDQLVIEVSAVKFMSAAGVTKAMTKVGDKKLCTAEISFSAMDLTRA